MTVNVIDHDKAYLLLARDSRYHAYHANGITAIEIKGERSKMRARMRVVNLGVDNDDIAYIYE